MTPRILLADDSPHAQRIGRDILINEGFEVELAHDGLVTYPLLEDFDPDVVLVDVFLPHRSGYEVCHWVKTNPRTQAARVVLTAGVLEPLDPQLAESVGADAILKKPFEVSEVLSTIRPLAEAAQLDRGLFAGSLPRAQASGSVHPPVRGELDPEKIEKAVAAAIEASLPNMIKEVTQRVLIALGH